MDMLEQIKKICRIYEIHPARSKGQNFLIDGNTYDKIVETAELKSDDVVLEVGPGLGFLTAKLAKLAKKVTAVELDDKLAHYLKTAVRTQGVKNVEVINENILDFHSVPEKKYKIVANLPYNITSVFLRKFLSEAAHKPELMVLMLQKEVAERIVAKPGEMSLLAVSVQFFADAERVQLVPKKYFWPAPEVDSAIVKFRVTGPRFLVDEKEFFRLVRIGFSAKRKMLKNNLAAGFHIPQAEAEDNIVKAGIDSKARAQELSLDDWAKLLKHFRQDVVLQQ